MVMTSDLVVQCGAPVYWKNAYSKCSENEWFGPLIKRRWRLLSRKVPLINLAAGSCQPFGSDGSEVTADADCSDYVSKFANWSALTTSRDALAQKILLQCGHNVPLLPCTAIFAPQGVSKASSKSEYVALNYMPMGGHYDLDGRSKDLEEKWEETFCREVRRLSAKKPCLLVCHDAKEFVAASRLFPEIARFYSKHWQDYVDVYSGCQYAVVNRVHGAIISAAMGKRVLLTGNDSRLLAAAQVPGVTALTVAEVLADFPGHLADVERAKPLDVTEMNQFRSDAKEGYLNALARVIKN